MSQSKERMLQIFHRYFTSKHHIVSMYLVSFDIIHSFGSQIVRILRINFIIISLLHVLPAELRANYKDSFLTWGQKTFLAVIPYEH